MTKFLAILVAIVITKWYADPLPKIMTAEETDIVHTDIRPTLVDGSTADASEFRSIEGALTYKRRISVPAALRSSVTRIFHENHESGLFAALMTAELVSRDFHWPAME